MHNFDHIAARIRKYREDRAWSQQQLAEVAHLTSRTVQRAEAGEHLSFYTLQLLAKAFEVDIEKLKASPEKKKGQGVEFLTRVTTGSDLCRVIGGADAYRFDNPEPHDEAEAKLIGGFLQDVRDHGDLWCDLEPVQQVEAAHGMTAAIHELENAGLWAFVGRRQETVRIPTADGGHTNMTWLVAIVVVHRDDDPTILRVGKTRDRVPAVVKNG